MRRLATPGVIALVIFVGGCVFFVDHELEEAENDDNNGGVTDDPSVSLSGPGDEVVVDAEGFAVSYSIGCEPADCEDHLYCRIDAGGETGPFEPCAADLELTDEDVGEGLHEVEVELRYDEDADEIPSDADETVVLYEFEVYAEGFDAGETRAFSHPYLGFVSFQCTHPHCEFDCGWETSEGDDVDADCAPGEELSRQIPEEAGSSPTLWMEGCSATEGLEDHCRSVEYDFEYASPSFRDVSAGQFSTCAVLDDGTLWCWGLNDDGQLGIEPAVLDDEDTVNRPVRVQAPGIGWEQVAVWRNHSCGIDEAGALYCWGSGGNHRLGTNDFNNRSVPQLTDDGPWETVDVGYAHTCAVSSGGSYGDGALVCSGRNDDGELGLGGSGTTAESMEVVELPEDVHQRWAGVTAGNKYTCGIVETDAGGRDAYCFGDAEHGRLGADSISVEEGDYESSPIRVDSPLDVEDVEMISAGTLHTCATASSGSQPRAYCWGRGDMGALGDGSQDGDQVEKTPVAVNDGEGFSYVTTGSEFSCAIDADQQLFCWGLNDSYQIGQQDPDMFSNPQNVQLADEVDAVEQVDTGAAHACAITDEAALYCWGVNNSGQVGVASEELFFEPTEVHWPYAEVFGE